MKLITLKEAMDILKNCAAVVVEGKVIGPALADLTLADLTGEDGNEWLYLQWDEKGYPYNIKFIEENNREITIAGGLMILTDSEGESCELTVLVPAQLEKN